MLLNPSSVHCSVMGKQELLKAGHPLCTQCWTEGKGTRPAYPAPCMFSTWFRLDSITEVKASSSSTCNVLHMLQIFLRATKAYSRMLKLWLKHQCSTTIRACFRMSFWKGETFFSCKHGPFYPWLYDQEQGVQVTKMLQSKILFHCFCIVILRQIHWQEWFPQEGKVSSQLFSFYLPCCHTCSPPYSST